MSVSMLLLYAATWTIVLMVIVAVASFSAEFAFVMAVLPPKSSLSKSCKAEGLIRIPVEVSGEVTCLPASMVRKSGLDVFVPIVCLALVVVGSASMLKAIGCTVDAAADYYDDNDETGQLI
ncbi:hypothetical protein POM88_002638 [Heracleum sosnowskyi]|uniref:Uncharacterized protein n=1 Tax=Heracleum sosnowskyi TaxID=360622 RepID=A0AAD8JH42_9APIA|nr:hypothetical protein POM88_002638 [Heracleum sosnowskyi]